LRIPSIILCALFVATGIHAQQPGHRRALLIGINDYSASRLGPPPAPGAVPDRDWANLSGAVNDVGAIEEMLVLLYGFDRRDIVTLTDQKATRDAILQSLQQHLVDPASKDDVLLLYYGGHGSQVRNSLSDERDNLDESLVPADSRLGARDIRDKELRRYFNQILDRGARLTVILDNCHSGSGARGLGTGAHPRGIKADLRDVADRVNTPKPENRGALVLAAAQDYDTAWETRDADHKFHGAFSWALIRSMRDASAGEAAVDTFLRAQARLRAEAPFQEPVLAGDTEAKLSPLLGARTDRRGDRPVVAVEKIQSDGVVVLQGGWANGLTVGTELHVDGTNARLKITAIRGMGRSEARAMPPESTIRAGALAQVVAWAAPAEQPLRVWMPRAAESLAEIAAIARVLAAEAKQHGVKWVTDPIDTTPTHLLRRGNAGWELLWPGGNIEPLATDAAAIAAVDKMPAGSQLFVQLPAPAATVDALDIGRQGVAAADGAEDADYILAGRFTSHHLSYAWVRPSVKKSDRRKTGLPLRTKWIRGRDPTPMLRDAVAQLRRIHSWNMLESPPAMRFPYQLAIRRAHGGDLARGSVIGEEAYELVLQVRTMPLPANVPARYIYAFAIDSCGKSTLLFPPAGSGSVENRFPQSPPPTEIDLGDTSAFEAARPYGIDTYFLLSTDEPLPDPSILEWDGVRGTSAGRNALEQLLTLTASGTRSASLLTPASWSIEKSVYESLAPHTTKSRQ
jgi:caspase domain-containing protein